MVLCESQYVQAGKDINSAPEGSDLKCMVRNIASMLSERNPERDQSKNWFEAENKLLWYVDKCNIGIGLNLPQAIHRHLEGIADGIQKSLKRDDIVANWYAAQQEVYTVALGLEDMAVRQHFGLWF